MERKYTHNVVIDLEFTPVPKRIGRRMGLGCEIIEVGAVKLDADGTSRAEFSRMVKPTLTDGVSGTVHHMTGIGNEDLTCARPLPEVLDALAEWIGPGRTRMVTWSGSDLRQIQTECAAKHSQAHRTPSAWQVARHTAPLSTTHGYGTSAQGSSGRSRRLVRHFQRQDLRAPSTLRCAGDGGSLSHDGGRRVCRASAAN